MTKLAKFELSVEDIFNEIQCSGEILKDHIDIFYLDVLSSLEEIKIALKALKKFQKKFLIGVHIKKIAYGRWALYFTDKKNY